MVQQWIRSQATFLYMCKRREHLLTADHSLECAYVRSYLKEKGIVSVQYVQDQLSDLFELVDDIISLGNERVIFHVDEDNYYVSRIIARELKKADDAIKIAWFGPVAAEYHETILQNDSVDVCIRGNDAEAVLQMLRQSGEEPADTEAAEPVCLDRIKSVYIGRILPLDRASQAGVMLMKEAYAHSVKYILEELDYINQNFPKPDTTIPLRCSDIFSFPEADELLSELSEKTYTIGLKASIHIKDLSGENLDRLSEAGIRDIEVTIGGEINPFNTNSWVKSMREHLNKELISGKKFKFSFIIESGYGKYPDDILLNLLKNLIQNRLASPWDIRFVSEESMLSPKIYPRRNLFGGYAENFLSKLQGPPSFLNTPPSQGQALLNGFIAYLTGIYNLSELNNGMKHLGVGGKMLSGAQLEKLKEYMNINSAFLASPASAAASAEIYSENDGAVRARNTAYDSWIEEAQKENCYLSHLYQVIPKSRRTDSILQLDDLYQPDPIRIEVKPYARSRENVDKALNFLSIEASADLEAFLNNADYFITTGRFRNEYELNSFVADTCRWSSMSGCHLNKLPRASLDEDENIHPCGGCGKSIGKLSDSRFNLVQNTYVITEQAQLARNCADCQVRNECSKCAMLPDFLSQDTYCKIMRERSYINEYLRTISVLSMLKGNSNYFMDARAKEIRVSNKYISHLLPNYTHREDTNYIHNFVFMFHVKDTPVIYNAATSRLLKMNEPLALIMEAFLKGISVGQLQDSISSRFSLDGEKSRSIIEQAAGIFAEAGCMWKMVV